jgi:hypothetical protein
VSFAARVSRELREKHESKNIRVHSRLNHNPQFTTSLKDIMLKQQSVSTSLGQLTVSSLTLGELRQLDSLFSSGAQELSGVASLLRYMPILVASLRKSHPDISPEQIENGLTLEDFNALFSAVLEVSGLKKASAGEAAPVLV